MIPTDETRELKVSEDDENGRLGKMHEQEQHYDVETLLIEE